MMIPEKPGLNCPQCQHLIEFTIDQMIKMMSGGDPVFCVSCGLKLTVDRKNAKEVENVLTNLNEGMEKAEKKEQEARSLGKER